MQLDKAFKKLFGGNMKKRILLTVLLFAALVLLFSSCDKGGLFCDHEYTVDLNDSTCFAEGMETKTCTRCGKIKSKVIEKKLHVFSDWEGISEPSCTADGEEKRICGICETVEKRTVTALGHSFGDFKTVIESSAVQNGLMEKKCDRCSLVESKVIQSLNFADTTVFLIEFSEDSVFSAESEEDFLAYCSAAVFNRAEKAKLRLGFEYGTLDALIDRLVENVEIPFSFGVSASLVGKDLTLTFEHTPEPSKATESDSPYVQRASASYTPITPSRASDYDEFKINKSAISYEVTTSEQLYYALECRVKPLPTVGSAAERLYGKMKAVLRLIISDGMDDFEKARAIYDWLIMNVTYDGELYDLLTLGTGEDSGEYNGFYLEGVFDDGFAVCDGISKAFVALANIEGIPCVQVSGSQAGNPYGVGHAWNKIYLDGKWYIVDATSGGTIVNQTHEVHSLCFFLITDGEMEKGYIGEGYTSLECNTEYSPFKSHSFTYGGIEYDLYIESQDELDALIRYFAEIYQSGMTVQFEIADSFNVGYSISEEISHACAVAGVTLSSSLVDGDAGEIITVW